MSNTTRPFTVLRRRSRLIDILIPKNAATQKYRLQASANFDGVFTQIVEADIGCGYLDPALRTSGKAATLQAVNNDGHVRCTFDPQTFAVTATIDDAQMFWLKFVAVDFAGTPGTATPPTLILPEEMLRGDSAICIKGTAPNAAAGSALQLYLPARMQDITIRNEETSTNLFVSTLSSGPEMRVDGSANALSQLQLARGAQGALFVRGGGATAAFSATMTSFLPL